MQHKMNTTNPSNLRAFGFIDPDQYPLQPDFHSEYPKRDEIDAAKAWFAAHAELGKNFMLRPTSYALKHRVERWAQRYVSNGALISAAIEIGYRWRRVMNGPNAVFKLRLPKAKNQDD